MKKLEVTVSVSITYDVPDEMTTGKAMSEIDLNWHSILMRESGNGAFSGPTDLEVDEWGYKIDKKERRQTCH